MPGVGFRRHYMFFDLRDYVRLMAPDKSFSDAYDKQLDKVILYDAVTEKFYGSTIPADRYCGITTYIPRSEWYGETNAYWNFQWAGVYDKDATE